MKKSNVLTLMAAGLALGFVACNNSSESTSTTDTTTTNTTTSTVTSSGNYAARADSVKANVSAGYYLNPKTGKAYTTLNVDQSTGALTDENGQPVRRYVDNRNWWVYDANSWDSVGSAQLKNGNLMYRDDKGDWEEYDKRWADDSSSMSNMSGMNSSTSDTTSTMSGEGSGVGKGVKVKVSDKGNKVKIKKTDN
jgi:ABC-type oligopeptide transport system substrate-binding subunit